MEQYLVPRHLAGLWCDNLQALVEIVLILHMTGVHSDCERIGGPVVQLFKSGAKAWSPGDCCIPSRVVHYGSTYFNFRFHLVVLADAAILRWHVNKGTPLDEVIISLSVALQVTFWSGHGGHILCFHDGRSCHRHPIPHPNFRGSCKALHCRVARLP